MTTHEQQERLRRFAGWLDRYGELSRDHQTFFAGPWTGALKRLYYRRPLAGTLAVAPLIAFEAFAPGMRRWFWKPQRFPIADAHYAMGFSYWYQVEGDTRLLQRAQHFLEVLLATRSPGYRRYGWGYPFDWVTRLGVVPAGTPLITTLPYVYEAFEAVYRIDGDSRWRDVMRSIAEHALHDYHEHETGEGATSCSYTPDPADPGGVVNASAYRAFLLTAAGQEFCDSGCVSGAARNLRYVLNAQNPDGSWPYATDGVRHFVDHFHTCFVLKALAKIEKLAPSAEVREAIRRGVGYYCRHLFDDNGWPKPFAKRPRLTVYKTELYDIAEFINLAVLIGCEHPELEARLAGILPLDGWQKPDGSFRSRRLLIGWDNVPMHRWAQSQLFRSLCFVLLKEKVSEMQPVCLGSEEAS